MSLLSATIDLAERAPLPDAALKLGVGALVGNARRQLRGQPAEAEQAFAQAMIDHPVALHADAANAQHYELPPEFFARVLGPRRKYSSCLYAGAAQTLAEAEVMALEETCRHANLRDGQEILELGCGWGSLSLWMAETLPGARITAVSNSRSQRGHIEARAAELGLNNLRVITADMNDFMAEMAFDRVVSVEMFEHMSNWRILLERVRTWLKPDGRLFIHIFSHRTTPYRFDHTDEADWIGRYFFTGGIMPSHGLMKRFPDLFEVEADWTWNGRHYERTALDWLANFDAHGAEIMQILRGVYDAEAGVWFKRWRLFFLATAGLFGHRGGEEWGVSHYRLRPAV
ncbi:SAM-dependent methyltransferase [Phenylobacterium montanum]|uniref:Class I SAM-dependent methyltransferase n=1 Tax=Phenylobacterium montanum TaxID=2823693 RepID=A0A975G0X8_9CAUL|nr:cyclopropane-fatty-acyl-phospholipid synthase family protein [Caulobacter sp. S6]QUD88759.1 class I SAM-dependent methyltransferase [Caulobacter sp. S6]